MGAAPALDLRTQLETVILGRIQADSLVLPAMPETAVHVMNAMRNPSAPLRDVAATLERDPLLCTQLLRTANAAVHGLGTIDSAEQALARLGAARVRSLVVAWCARRVFLSHDPQIRALVQNIWQSSLMTALLARDLTALGGTAAPETAFLAGLLQDVGKPVVAAFLLELEKHAESRGQRSVGAETFRTVVDQLARPVAVAIVEKWNLSDVVAATIRNASDLDAVNRQSVANYVRFASAVVATLVASHGPQVEEAKALVMVGRSLLELDDEMVGRLTKDLHDRARRMTV